MFSVEFGTIYRIFLISSVSELFGNSSRINFFRVVWKFFATGRATRAVQLAYYLSYFGIRRTVRVTYMNNSRLTRRPSDCLGLGLGLELWLGAGLGPWDVVVCWCCSCCWFCLWAFPDDFFSWCLSECRRAVILAGPPRGPRTRRSLRHPSYLLGWTGWDSQHRVTCGPCI